MPRCTAVARCLAYVVQGAMDVGNLVETHVVIAYTSKRVDVTAVFVAVGRGIWRSSFAGCALDILLSDLYLAAGEQRISCTVPFEQILTGAKTFCCAHALGGA